MFFDDWHLWFSHLMAFAAGGATGQQDFILAGAFIFFGAIILLSNYSTNSGGR